MASPFASIATTMPGQNQQLAQGAEEARKTQMQQSIAQATKTPPAAQAAQQAGAQAAQQQGAIQLGAQEATSKGFIDLGAQELERQKADDAMRMRKKVLAEQTRNFKEQQRLGTMDSALKQQLIDSKMQFATDELGRTIFNDQQLLDFKLTSAKNAEDLRNFEQELSQESAKRMQILEVAQAKLKQQLQQEFDKGEQEANQEQKARLGQAISALQAKKQREIDRKKNRAAGVGAAFSVVGTVAGGIIGAVVTKTPQGAVAGASVGSSLGSGIGQAFSSQNS